MRRAFLTAPLARVLRGQEAQTKMFGNAEAYERFMGRWSRLVAPRLVAFSSLPERGRMLDVGSGTGSLAFAIAEHKKRVNVLGIDPSKEYVAYATNKNRFSDRVSFELGDAQQLRFPDAGFDAVLSLLVFNFIPDPKKALLELRRVTKPGGTISAAVWDYGSGMRMLRVFWDAVVHLDPVADRIDEKHMPLCREGELSALWREGGLQDVRERPIDIEMRFESFADYWDPFVHGQGPGGAYVRGLDHNREAALREEVRRRLGVKAENAGVILTGRVWSVRGTVPQRG